MSARCCVDVVIPVYRPQRDDRLLRCLKLLSAQTVPARSVTLINTAREHFEEWAFRTDFYEAFKEIAVRHISEEEFDHAGARNMGAALGSGEYILFMTMDAVPADERLIESLVNTLEGAPEMAAVYARQLPWPGASVAERTAREFNYPAESAVKTKKDMERLGIKAFFMSNVCAMYKRKSFEELGGFEAPAIFNEDMVFAKKALLKGYSVGYEAGARVYHSHDYTAGEQLHRNFDLGVSQAMHPEVFGGISSEGEGMKLIRLTLLNLKKSGHIAEIPSFLITCAARYMGYRLGKSYKRLPRAVILKLTANRNFWK